MARNRATKKEIEEFVKHYYDMNFDYERLRKYYMHEAEICQNTVPQAIYCFLISDGFEDCLRTTISIGGDCDTTAAISCAIAEAYYGIPECIAEAVMEFIPERVKDIVISFEREFQASN
jgi:type I restriction enzyme M protein